MSAGDLPEDPGISPEPMTWPPEPYRRAGDDPEVGTVVVRGRSWWVGVTLAWGSAVVLGAAGAVRSVLDGDPLWLVFAVVAAVIPVGIGLFLSRPYVRLEGSEVKVRNYGNVVSFDADAVGDLRQTLRGGDRYGLRSTEVGLFVLDSGEQIVSVAATGRGLTRLRSLLGLRPSGSRPRAEGSPPRT